MSVYFTNREQTYRHNQWSNGHCWVSPQWHPGTEAAWSIAVGRDQTLYLNPIGDHFTPTCSSVFNKKKQHLKNNICTHVKSEEGKNSLFLNFFFEAYNVTFLLNTHLEFSKQEVTRKGKELSLCVVWLVTAAVTHQSQLRHALKQTLFFIHLTLRAELSHIL